MVHCFCVCSGSALLGDLFGVSRSMDCGLLSVLSYPRFCSSVCIILYHYHATLCISAVFAVARCQSVCDVGALYPDGWRYQQTSFSTQ